MTQTFFNLRIVSAPADVVPLGEWLVQQERQETPIALTVKARQKKIAFATKDDAWVLDLKANVGDLALSTLRGPLLDRRGLVFLMRDMSRNLPEATEFLAKQLGADKRDVFDSLKVVGDLTCAARCINQSVTPANKFRKIEHDAYEVALLEPQYSYDAPSYYQRVGMPMARMVAERYLFTSKKDVATWFVSYKDLWIKTLAYYTQDPTLLWSLNEGHDVIEDIAKMFHCDYLAGEDVLLYAACGFDITTFTKRFPQRLNTLPHDRVAWEAEIGRRLPSLTSAVKAMREAYWADRLAETVYGRRLRPGHPLGDAVAFRFFGTVEDLVGVAVATFWKNRADHATIVLSVDGGPDARDIRISGKGGTQLWLMKLREWSNLANPLRRVSLAPLIVEL